MGTECRSTSYLGLKVSNGVRTYCFSTENPGNCLKRRGGRSTHGIRRHVFPSARLLLLLRLLRVLLQVQLWKHVWFEEIGHTLLTVCLEGIVCLVTPGAGCLFFRRDVTLA